MKKQVLILGGTDGFGKWLAEFILQDFGEQVQVIVTGRDVEKGTKVATELGVIFTNNNSEFIETADVVIFSVPIAYMEQSIKELAPHIKKGATVLDVCSVKNMPSQALKKHCHTSCIIIPTHPMFGPYISSIAGQVIVLTPESEAKNTPEYILLKKYLEKAAARVLETEAKEHDQMMAVVQGLTHFDMFIFGETLKKLDFDIHKSLDFISPIYKIILSSVARYVGQNPKLYSDIQMYNPEVLKVHETFIEVTKQYNEIVKNKDEAAFIKTVSETKAYFGEKNTEAGQKYTDKIIYLLGKQTQKAQENIGKEINLCNIYDKKIVSGILQRFENDLLTLSDGEYHIDEWEIVT